jgi:predicted DCC family thiol-disulfide oxidoreductase YuxK
MSSAEQKLKALEGCLEASVEDPQQIEVWMDGGCGVCRRSKAWCEFRDRDGRINFRDFRSARENELPVSREDLEASMWARDSTGDLYEGYAAWLRIMAELPRWRWLARLASLPPFTLIGPALYRLLAANRYRFGR